MKFELMYLRMFLGVFKGLALFAFFGICAGNLHHIVTLAIFLTMVLVLKAEVKKNKRRKAIKTALFNGVITPNEATQLNK